MSLTGMFLRSSSEWKETIASRPLGNSQLGAFLRKEDLDKVIFFWNNRNARRKQSGSLIYWVKAFLDKVGHDKAALVMHTDVKDMHGQDLEAIINDLGLVNGEVVFSVNKYSPDIIAKIFDKSWDPIPSFLPTAVIKIVCLLIL